MLIFRFSVFYEDVHTNNDIGLRENLLPIDLWHPLWEIENRLYSTAQLEGQVFKKSMS